MHFQRDFQKAFFSSEKHFGLSPNKNNKNLQDQNRSWVDPNKTLAIKKYFEREGSFEGKI